MYEKRRAIHRKMIVHPELKAAVEDRLKAGWSPEQIAGRMRLERHPIRVSHETIYRFTCSKDGRAEQFYRHLPEHRRRRRPRGYQGAGGGRIVLPDEQIAARDEIRRTVAREALGRFAVGEEELIKCCKFLAERWHAWSREGRPIAAAAYKIFSRRACACCHCTLINQILRFQGILEQFCTLNCNISTGCSLQDLTPFERFQISSARIRSA